MNKPNFYVALFNGSNELSGAGYQRALVTTGFHFQDGMLVNDQSIIFREALANWEKITHFTFCTKLTGGKEFLSRGALRPSPRVKAGDSVSFAVGSLKIVLIEEI